MTRGHARPQLQCRRTAFAHFSHACYSLSEAGGVLLCVAFTHSHTQPSDAGEQVSGDGGAATGRLPILQSESVRPFTMHDRTRATPLGARY